MKEGIYLKFLNKTLLLRLVLSFIGALTLGTVPASAETVTLKFVGSHGPTTGWAWPAYPRLGEAVEKATEGRVKLQFYQPGQLVPFVQHLEAVRAGILDVAAVVPGYYQNEFALSSLWNYMYTYYPNAQTSAHMWFDLYDQYMSIDFDKLDLVCPGGNGWPVVPYDLFTIDRPVKTVEDMKGLKLRSNSGAMNKIIESGGGVPVFMGGGQVPDALSKGMLNGTPMSDHWGTAVKVWEYGNPGYWTITGSFPQGVSAACLSTREKQQMAQDIQGRPGSNRTIVSGISIGLEPTGRRVLREVSGSRESGWGDHLRMAEIRKATADGRMAATHDRCHGFRQERGGTRPVHA